METEIWKDIPGYNVDYKISNLGKVKSLKRGSERILLPWKISGYPFVALSKNNKASIFSVHRLVAQAFIPNTENKPQVNHINGIKTDNNYKNLEWCTASENVLHAFRTGLMKPKFGKENCSSKPINQFSKDGILIREWFSARDACSETGVNYRVISRCAKGIRKSAGGYVWKFKR